MKFHRALVFLIGSLLTPAVSSAIILSGVIGKNNEQMLVSYDLKVGSEPVTYVLRGSSSTDKGFYWSAVDYSYIEALKVVSGQSVMFENSGILQVYPRQRISDNLVLFGMEIEGYYVQGSMDDRIEMTTLAVNGTACKGEMNYNNWSGKYHAINGFSFGKYKIQSSLSKSDVIMNYDDIKNQNAMSVSMKFGDLVINGKINYTDVTRTDWDCDEDGCSSDEVVVSTTGIVNAQILKQDGSQPELSSDAQNPKEDDKTLQAFLALFQLINFDISAE